MPAWAAILAGLGLPVVAWSPAHPVADRVCTWQRLAGCMDAVRAACDQAATLGPPFSGPGSGPERLGLLVSSAVDPGAGSREPLSQDVKG